MKYDVIVVGGRCAGAPLALLLARAGLRVLVVDAARFPSDTISTHLIWPPGVAALYRWGLREAIHQADPAVCRTSHAFFPGGDLRGPWHAVDGVDHTLNLRRIKLDAILLQAAREAGAEVREGAAVESLLFEDGRVTGIRALERGTDTYWEERASIVAGADGRDSAVARLLQAPFQLHIPPLTASYYTLIEETGFDRDVDEIHTQPPREFLFVPTDSNLTLVNLVIARDLLDEFRRDVTAGFYRAFDLVPDLGARLRAGRCVDRVRGAVDLPNFYRQSCGPGWALVGDAGFHKDPIRAQGITDAFLDAENLACALVDGLGGRRDLDIALQHCVFERNRRTHFPFQLCLRAARFETTDPADVRAFLELVRPHPKVVAAFRGLAPGSMSPEVFFGPQYYGGLQPLHQTA